MRFMYVMLLVLAVSISGCALSQKRVVDGLVKDGLDHVNSIVYSKLEGRGALRFYSRISGPERQRIQLADYKKILALPASWGELRLHALPTEAAALKLHLGLSGDDRSDAVKRLPSVSVKTLAHALDEMPTLTDRLVLIDVYLAPMDSGRETNATYPVSDDQLQVALLFQTEERGPGVEWGSLMSLISHEMLHIHYRMAGLSPNKLDEEVAAYLTGYCARAWSVKDMQAKKAALTVGGMDKKVYQRVFPGLLDGRWDPQVDRFRREFGISQPSAQARMMTIALIYHRYARDGVVDLTDRDAVAPMLEDCRRLSLGPPRYSKGESGPSIQ